MPITIAGSSNPVFLTIRKKAVIKYWLKVKYWGEGKERKKSVIK